MKYLLLICTEAPDEPGAPPVRAAQVRGPAPAEMDVEDWVSQLDGNGTRLMGERTRPADDATTVRVRDDQVLTTDGPYAETREQMAGFDVIECADLDAAIDIASRHPMARGGMVEVRPFWM